MRRVRVVAEILVPNRIRITEKELVWKLKLSEADIEHNVAYDHQKPYFTTLEFKEFGKVYRAEKIKERENAKLS